MIPLRIVLDTSVLISFVLSKGNITQQIIVAWRTKEVELLITAEILAELRKVLERPVIQARAKEPILRLYTEVDTLSLHVPGRLAASGVCRDPKDDKFLACAVEGQAHYLVSSDKDLLVFGRYEGVCILNPGQFLVALQLARLSAVEIRQRYSREGLQTILAQLCLEAGTRDKVERALGD